MKAKWIIMAPVAILGIALFTFIGGELVRQLWNWLMPPLFGWRAITFWQAVGLLALCRILFGGGGRYIGSRPGTGVSERIADRVAERVADRVAERVDERTKDMTPEERERCRQIIRERFGVD